MAASLLDGLLEFYVAMGAGIIAGLACARAGVRDKGQAIMSRVVLFILAPVLVFTSLVNAEITLSPTLVINIVLVQLATSLAMMGIAFIVLKRRRVPDTKLGAYLLVAGFPNATIFPLPIVIAVWGPAYVTIIVLFSASELVLRGTLGTYLSMRLGAAPPGEGDGGGKRAIPVKKTLKTLLLFPPTLAILVAVAWVGLQLPVPKEALDIARVPISKVVSWTGAAMIGMVLSGLTRSMFATFKPDIPGSMMLRFVLPLLVYFPLAAFMDFSPEAAIIKSILLLEVIGPPAVMNAIYAVNFKLDKEFAASMVAILTLAMIVLAPLVILLGGLLFAP